MGADTDMEGGASVTDAREDTLRIRAVGDVLIHRQIYEAARTGPGTYDFRPIFAPLRAWMGEADIAIANQETPLVADEARVSSFPAFGTPVAIGEAEAWAGFTVVTQATNHALDQGSYGIHCALDFWGGFEGQVRMLGLHGSREDSNRIDIIERNGIRVALVNATELLNYHLPPAREPWCVEVLKPWSRKRILAKVARARAVSDFVVVLPHWGCEYLYAPVRSQRRWAQALADAGADLIIGTHPHVIEPVEELECADGRMTLCYWSLGNFVSCQVHTGTMLGGLADVLIKRGPDGRGVICDYKLDAVVTHTNEDYSAFSAVRLEDYTDEMAQVNKVFSVVRKNHGIVVDLAYLNGLYDRILAGTAQETSEFKSPRDVRMSNIKGIWRAVRGRSNKG